MLHFSDIRLRDMHNRLLFIFYQPNETSLERP